ncbi:SPRY domain-containing protein [Paenibacillus sp. N1-5-1-14]|uniref:SPRY domain-containing protein n=1 Tax=Paenibacillus radicibacter TaxID=2972488 RepID=UPI002159637D|nr:SPRY domain-containing protein [Paenibacillus radicibacter]MCR8641569.1 SPRY domain-containing protein [Paenibacillus radicibacter]
MATVNVTLNPNDTGIGNVLSNGNLTITNTKVYSSVRATHGKTKGKWYWEVKWNAGAISSIIGVANKTYNINTGMNTDLNVRSYAGNGGFKYPENTKYADGWLIGDVIGVALDLDKYSLTFYKNGVNMGISHTNLNVLGEVFPMISSMETSSKTLTVNFGATPFAYPIPSGFNPYIGYDINRILIFNNNYLKYVSESWLTITSDSPTESDYFNGNTTEEMALIPESAWSKLIGDVELCYYTDNLSKTEASFNIETEPFTLAEEWEDKTIKVIEYTDDLSQTESTVTFETEPFSIYDECGDSVDVLYYTDDPSKKSVELNVSTNYSPLDELEDPELIVWTNDTSTTTKQLDISAIPRPQLVIPMKDIDIKSDSQKLVLNVVQFGLNPTTKSIKVICSVDQGVTWKTFKNKKWKNINIGDLANVKRNGIAPSEFNLISMLDWIKLSPIKRIRFAYYLEQDDVIDDIKIESLISTESSTTETPALNSLSIIYDELDKKYSGLMFMDTTQQYYTSSIGEILKYLDMGTLIAGQTSLDIKVKLSNTYPFDVKNIKLWSEHNINGLSIELSKQTNPFIAESELFYEQEMKFDSVIEFYVRLVVDSTAKASSGNFDVRVSAEPI